MGLAFWAGNFPLFTDTALQVVALTLSWIRHGQNSAPPQPATSADKSVSRVIKNCTRSLPTKPVPVERTATVTGGFRSASSNILHIQLLNRCRANLLVVASFGEAALHPTCRSRLVTSVLPGGSQRLQ